MNYTTINGKPYTIETFDNFLLVNNNEKTFKIKVIENWEYTFKCNQKSISAKNGVKGLYEFFEYTMNSNVMQCYTDKIIDFVVGLGIEF